MARAYVARPGLSAAIGLVVIALALTSACAARGFTPPSGPEVAEPDAPKIWAAVTARCQGVRLYVAELRVNGWAGDDRQTFAATMHGAVTRAGDAYLEVPAPLGGPVLQLAGRAGDATFVLPRDRRVLQAPTREIVAALTGLRWGPEQLLDVLSGCVAAPGHVSGARVGRSLQVDVAAGVRVWLQPHEGTWRVRAARIDGWFVEYLRYADAWPAHVRVTASSPTPLDITFAAAKVQTNIELPDTAFTLAAPPDFEPMTLEELRAIGPLRERAVVHSEDWRAGSRTAQAGEGWLPPSAAGVIGREGGWSAVVVTALRSHPHSHSHPITRARPRRAPTPSRIEIPPPFLAVNTSISALRTE